MKSLQLLLMGIWLLTTGASSAAAKHLFLVTSPSHGQTFAYGSEKNRAWVAAGKDRHLALKMEFTNDPYVDRVNVRQYDDFTFDFPGIKQGRDGRTFYYQTSDRRSLSVARKEDDFLGVGEIKLLPSSRLVIQQPHGYLTLTLFISDRSLANGEN